MMCTEVNSSHPKADGDGDVFIRFVPLVWSTIFRRLTCTKLELVEQRKSSTELWSF